MAQNRKSRNNPMPIQSMDMWKRMQEHTMGIKTVHSISGIEKIGQANAKKSD